LQINERIVNEVVILDLKGKMTLGEGDEFLKNTMDSLVSKRVYDILVITKLVRIFDSYEDENEAVRSFAS
jgi:anti-sigma B factor antagonist